MSKYTRLNKINHYHDSGPMNPTTIQESRIRPPLNTSNNSNLNSNKQEGKLIGKSSGTFPLKDGKKSNASSKTLLPSNLKLSKKLNTNTNITMNYNLKLAFLAFVSILLVLLVSLNVVYSLNCYQCSSIEDPTCDERLIDTTRYNDTDCSKSLKPGQTAKVCRKIIQYIEEKRVVIRSCGFIDEHEEKDRKPMCYKRSGTFAIMMESCNCYEDNCNHSASLVPNGNVLLLLVASCSLLFYYTSVISGYVQSTGEDKTSSR